jgi:hypothetical protein
MVQNPALQRRYVLSVPCGSALVAQCAVPVRLKARKRAGSADGSDVAKLRQRAGNPLAHKELCRIARILRKPIPRAARQSAASDDGSAAAPGTGFCRGTGSEQ